MTRARDIADLIGKGGDLGPITIQGSNAFEELFRKADPDSVVFTKTSAGTASIKAGTKVEVANTIVAFSSATPITMPTLTAGTDYAVWVKDDGTIQADVSPTVAPGAGNWRKIGGFHYAPSNLNIDSTPNINAYSMWDLKFRPACPDPRGMVLVADGFWVDIYLLGTNPDVDGTSALGATIADGSSPPKIPALFGGNGAADYGSLTWYEASEVMAAYGKQLLDYAEFAVAAYGSAEASSVGADPVTVQHQAGRVSKWGVEQATGVMWIWGRQLGGPDSGTAWTASTEGRGSVNSQPNAALFGGDWVHAASTGSRCAAWNGAPSFSDSSVGARGRCDHYRSN